MADDRMKTGRFCLLFIFKGCSVRKFVCFLLNKISSNWMSTGEKPQWRAHLKS